VKVIHTEHLVRTSHSPEGSVLALLEFSDGRFAVWEPDWCGIMDYGGYDHMTSL